MARRKKGQESPGKDGEARSGDDSAALEADASAEDTEPIVVGDGAQPEQPGAPQEPQDDGEVTDRWTLPGGEPPGATVKALFADSDTDAEADAASDAAEGAEGGAEAVEVAEPARLEGIVESLLFAADRPLGVAELKRLLGERDGKRVTDAVEALQARRAGSGVEVTAAAGGWQLRTNTVNAPWVAKLLSAKPARLSRAMLETLAIVAYRQPVTRPEIDDVRGVDCGPVLKTLLERGLIRILGKKEEVGRPLLYGTTQEFLRTFNLLDLTELPTLREFHELGNEERAQVDAQEGVTRGAARADAGASAEAGAAATGAFKPHPPLAPDVEEDQGLLDELDRAAHAAARAVGAREAEERPEQTEKTEKSAPTDEASAPSSEPSDPSLG